MSNIDQLIEYWLDDGGARSRRSMISRLEESEIGSSDVVLNLELLPCISTPQKKKLDLSTDISG